MHDRSVSGRAFQFDYRRATRFGMDEPTLDHSAHVHLERSVRDVTDHTCSTYFLDVAGNLSTVCMVTTL